MKRQTTLLGLDLLIGTPKLFWVFQSNVATITRYLNADWSTRMGGCPEIDKEELESQSRRRCGPVLH